MVVVPAGAFTMGSGDYDSEKPPHQVTIPKPFAVGKFEVTFSEWDACVAAGACKHKPGDEGWGRDKRPVINVSWDDITKEYLPWLSRQAGKTYRLLSEAEWEYAARAGGKGKYSFGEADGELGQHAWYSVNAGGETQSVGGKPQPVGGKKPNAFGLQDMHGNVWEWVEDCWNGSYAAKPAALKASGAAWTTGDCGRRVLRGGSWLFGPKSLRSAQRNGDQPVDRFTFNGFRVARTITP